MRKRSPKNLRVSQEVARELSVIIRGLKDPRIGLMTSVMDAEVAPDLKTCKVYISVLGSEEEQQEYGRMMRERGPKVHIRPYQASDRPGVEHVCLVTASDYLNSTEELRQATLDTYCHYYIEREPEHCFVIADENNDAVGYIFCAQDYTAWKKCFTEEYLEKTENPYTKKMGYAEIEGYIELAEDFPAHLHIDIDPAYQRKGYGSQLVDALVAHLKAIGVKGVMLETGASNEKGMNFYKKYGFEVLRDDGQGVCFGIRL